MKLAIAAIALLSGQSLALAAKSDADIAARVSCDRFRKNPDGSWTAAPNTMVGDVEVSGNVLSPGRQHSVGADLARIVERKCGGRKR